MSTAQNQSALQQHNQLVDQAVAMGNQRNMRAAAGLMLQAQGLWAATGPYAGDAQSKWGQARARLCSGDCSLIIQMPDSICTNAPRCRAGGATASSSPASSGSSGGTAAAPVQTGPTTAQNVGTVLTGVGAILGPLANAFATGYSAKLQVDAQKAQLRQQQSISAFPSVPFIPSPPPRSNTGLIIAGVGGVLVLGVIIFAVAS